MNEEGANVENAQVVDRPITVALVDDYDVVLAGLSGMLAPYRERVLVAELDTNRPVATDVDVVLYDSFAQPVAGTDELAVLIANPHARRVAVYTWNFHSDLIETALRQGVCGYLSKALPAGDLVSALEAIQAGSTVVSPTPGKAHPAPGLDWPGRVEGLTARESEILALITQGKSNAEIAATTYLSINSIKSYVRSTYRKIGARSRTQAVLWGVEHGFRPDHHRVDLWRS